MTHQKCYLFNKAKLLFTLMLIVALIVGCQEDNKAKLHFISGRTMGTSFSIKIVKDNRPNEQYNKLEPEINALLVEVNRQMSTYLPESEISMFNIQNDTGWFDVSRDFANVMNASLEICQQTEGALDITVGPLVNLWGFGPENRPTIIPSDAEIAERQNLVGYNKISVRLDPPAVKKSQSGMYCDLSSTAKGFGVDKVAEYLESENFSNYFVEIGGEARAKGNNERGQIWRVGVTSPERVDNIQKVVWLQNKAIATSGDYFNYYEMDGKRYSHTIDPQTGKPVTHKLASVTVVSDNCMTADGFATAIDVMGPERGFQFAAERKLPVFMIVREGEIFVEKMTPEFSEMLKTKK